jgi:hypothetical protein
MITCSSFRNPTHDGTKLPETLKGNEFRRKTRKVHLSAEREGREES